MQATDMDFANGEKVMNSGVGDARIGQWYVRRDNGETFQVTGLDDESGTIEVQGFDGDLNEIERQTWNLLPLALAEPPQDWTGPVDDADVDEVGSSGSPTTEEGWRVPLQSQGATPEQWEVLLDVAERDAAVKDTAPAEELPAG